MSNDQPPNDSARPMATESTISTTEPADLESPAVLDDASHPSTESLSDLLFKDIEEASRVADRAISKVNTVRNATATHSGSQDDCAGVKAALFKIQSEILSLKALKSDVKANVLEVLVGTDDGRKIFDQLRGQLQQFASDMQPVQCATVTLTEFQVDGDPPVPLSEWLDTLCTDLSSTSISFRDLYVPSDRLINSFNLKGNAFGVTYLQPQRVAKEGANDQPQKIARRGRMSEPIAMQLGKLWIERVLGNHTLSVPKLQEAQVDVLECLDSYVGGSLRHRESKALRHLHESMKKEIDRAKSQTFCVAFCGMVKAGKSLFLNALTGRQLLPSDELPATAWPCRLLHDPEKQTPTMSVNTKYFDEPLKRLRERRIAAAMESYHPPARYLSSFVGDDDDDGDDFESDASSTLISDQDDQLVAIYLDWKDLHDCTKDNLKLFEQASFRLPSSADGDDAVLSLLGMVNDIVRLCRIYKIDIPEAKPDTWPRLTVEFKTLRERTIEGTFEFIDLPGVGEADSDFHSFEDLVRIAAREANTVIPIISFQEVSKGDWRRHLPQIVQTGLNRPPDFVLCTHMDQVQSKGRVSEQVAMVGKEFWTTLPDVDRRVLRCSTRLGIGARMLIAQSQNEKPNFEDIWKEDTITRECAMKILGSGNPVEKYQDMEHEKWLEALQEQLKDSCLEDAITQLTTGLVDDAQVRACQREGEKLIHKIDKISLEKRRQLEEMSRPQVEFEKAYRLFERSREELKNFNEFAEDESRKSRDAASPRLKRAYSRLEQRGWKSALSAVDSAAKRGNVHVEKNTSNPTTSTEEMVFENKLQAESFIHAAQKVLTRKAKNTVLREFVDHIRLLTDESRLQLLFLLTSKLKPAEQETASPDFIEGIVIKFSEQGRTVDALFTADLDPKNEVNVVRTEMVRHSAASAYNAIRGAMAKPFVSSHEGPVALSGNIGGDNDITSPQTTSELGFMIRAPIAVLATIPLVLGSFVWPWVIRRKRFVIDKEVLARNFHEIVQKPFFEEIKREAERTMDTAINKTSKLAQKIVTESLAEEQARFEREISTKNLSAKESTPLAIDTVSTLWNLSAAEAALKELQVKFGEVLPKV